MPASPEDAWPIGPDTTAALARADAAVSWAVEKQMALPGLCLFGGATAFGAMIATPTGLALAAAVGLLAWAWWRAACGPDLRITYAHKAGPTVPSPSALTTCTAILQEHGYTDPDPVRITVGSDYTGSTITPVLAVNGAALRLDTHQAAALALALTKGLGTWGVPTGQIARFDLAPAPLTAHQRLALAQRLAARADHPPFLRTARHAAS